MSLWGILLKARWHPRWQIQGSLWKCHIFTDLHYFCFFEGSDLHFFYISTYLSFYNIFISKGGVKDGFQNTLVTNLAIIMSYNLQHASFMHISSPINAIEYVYVTLGHFVKIKMASKMADSMFFMEISYFSTFALFFSFFVGSDLHFSENG